MQMDRENNKQKVADYINKMWENMERNIHYIRLFQIKTGNR